MLASRHGLGGALGLALAAALVLVSAVAAGATARVYADPIGDVRGGAGPDLRSLRISHTATTVTFEVRFRTAPPLRMSEAESWVDMLLMGLDVPPIGPSPVSPGGEWRGMDYALGTHGPSTSAILTRLQGASNRVVARFPLHRNGATLTLTLWRTWLGSPAFFRFSLAAAREGEVEGGAGGGLDLLPGTRTARYVLTG